MAGRHDGERHEGARVSRREDIDNAVWDDEDFAALTAPAKLVYLWSFTNRRCGMAGLYKVTVRAIAGDTNLDVTSVEEALEVLADARFLFHEEGVLWVRSRVKLLRSRNPGIAKAIVADVASINPAHPLRARFLEEYRDVPWPGQLLPELLADLPNETVGQPLGNGSETVGQPLGNGSRSPGTEPYPKPLSDRSPTVQGKGIGIGSSRSGGSGGRTILGDAALAAELGRPEADVVLAAAQVRAHGGTVTAGTVGDYIRSRPDLFEDPA